MTPVTYHEQALVIECGTERLVGILAEPPTSGEVAVVIVVGGPQYRVGSHRQFVLLARALAKSGIAAMRFDMRGMGDSTGSQQSFDSSDFDIACAIDALVKERPRIRRVVLWGLCDAASAILLYAQASSDPRLAGLALANPWVRSDVTYAKTQLLHYYGRRIVQRDFWRKLVRLEVDVVESAASVARQAAVAGRLRKRKQAGSFQERMAAGLRGFAGPVLLLLSGQDLTAREFVDYAGSNERWRGLLARDGITRQEFAEADHTFSSARLRADAEASTLEWMRTHFAPR